MNSLGIYFFPVEALAACCYGFYNRRMNGSIRDANLAFFEQRFPQAAQAATRADAASAEVVEARRVGFTLRVKIGERDIFLHSRYDPVTEAERWAETQVPPEGAVVLLFGWGLGYHALAWIRRYAKRVKWIIALEPQAAWLARSLELLDLGLLAGAPNLDIISGYDSQTLYRTLLKRMEPILSAEMVAIPAPFANCYSSEALNILKTEANKIASTREAMLEHMEGMGSLCQANLIANWPSVGRAAFLRDLVGAAQSQPAVIVAAGPSLNRNIHLLPQAQGRAWIIACDTSRPILRSQGVSPHIVVSKDPTERNLAHFVDVSAEESVILAFDPQVDPRIPSLWPGPLLLIPNRNNAVHRYIKGLELTQRDRLPLSVNVAVAAFNLAARMGCDPILFVGLDLCFARERGFSHADGAALSLPTCAEDGVLAHGEIDASESVETLEVEGVDGLMYPTTSTFYEALRLLESNIAACQAHCIDASEGGARVAGTETIPLAQALERYCVDAIQTILPWDQTCHLRDRRGIRRSLEAVAEHIEQCGAIATEALRRLDQEGADIEIAALELARASIELEYRLYHEMQTALERLLVEISRVHWLNAQTVASDELLRRYRRYFNEIADASAVYALKYREAAQAIS